MPLEYPPTNYMFLTDHDTWDYWMPLGFWIVITEIGLVSVYDSEAEECPPSDYKGGDILRPLPKFWTVVPAKEITVTEFRNALPPECL